MSPSIPLTNHRLTNNRRRLWSAIQNYHHVRFIPAPIVLSSFYYLISVNFIVIGFGKGKSIYIYWCGEGGANKNRWGSSSDKLYRPRLQYIYTNLPAPWKGVNNDIHCTYRLPVHNPHLIRMLLNLLHLHLFSKSATAIPWLLFALTNRMECHVTQKNLNKLWEIRHSASWLDTF